MADLLVHRLQVARGRSPRRVHPGLQSGAAGVEAVNLSLEVRKARDDLVAGRPDGRTLRRQHARLRRDRLELATLMQDAPGVLERGKRRVEVLHPKEGDERTWFGSGAWFGSGIC